ncbi:serine/threonine-protein kinase [Kitasatospora sp. A2-31]|uniref:serine/threonine-protein kinase n=1 Tax=Kitasatospora sp. A2-31 TaxID=2916414 RepID=UPI001EE7E128|nr:serine/threonine-protein kinase [Kitasatospora sp. A2-31]MCG6493784.1 serine/threonine protein kinase [Kitasatospora sp. A2-31]
MRDREQDDGTGSGRGGWQLPEYRHVRELGAGAAGRVVLAHHDPTGTPVAIKYLHDAAGGAELRREAAVLARVDSPYVTRLYEYVECGPYAAIVMELIDGISLRALLRAEGATTPEAALVVLKGSLLGLAAAHAVGLVHRDYKPANVLVAANGTTKLVDFGIAVPSGDDRDVSGTPAYLAPEQWTGAPASPAADVYAATVTFFECLTGARPYTGGTLAELAVQHRESPVPDGLVPEAVRPLVRAGLAKEPGDRPVGAAEFVRLLEAAATAGYGRRWEERGRSDLAALVALLAALLPWGAAGPPPGGTTALAHTELVAAQGAAASRGEHARGGRSTATRSEHPRGGASASRTVRRLGLHGRVRAEHPRRRRARAVAGAVASTLAAATLAAVAVAGTGDRGERTALGSPLPELTTTLGPAGGGGGETSAGSSDPTTSAASSGGRTSTDPPSSSTSGPASLFESSSPSAPVSPPPTSSQPPRPSPSKPPTTGTASGRSPSPTPGRTSGTTPPPGTATSSTARLTDAPRTTPPTTSTTAATVVGGPPTVVTPPPVTRVTSLNVDSVSCLDSSVWGIQARITVVSSGPPGATLTVSWQHHSGANNAPVTVATDTVRLGTGSVTLTPSHVFGNDDSVYWGVRVVSDPRPDSTTTGYRELRGFDCRQPG